MNWADFSADGLGGRGRGALAGISYCGGTTGRGTNSFSAGRARGGGLTGSGADGGSETPRVAIIGTGSRVFQQWCAIHAGGLRVSVVVGTEDAKVSHSSNALTDFTVSDAEKKASAEMACATALRCVQFYRLPQATESAAAGDDKPLVNVLVRVSDDVADPTTGLGAGAESRKTSTASAAVTSSILASASAASTAAREKDCVIATAWSWFLKPLLNTRSGGTAPFSSSATVTGAGFWSARPGAGSLSPTHAATGNSGNSLVDDVEVIYLVDYGANCDEAGVRTALLWLLEHNKQVVVECALSAETLATCAAAAAAVTRGKPEMKRLFLYRGGGCRRGWSAAAVAQLRKSLGVRRATGRRGGTASPASNPANAVLGGRSVFTRLSTNTVMPAFDSNCGFSVFDLMGSTFGSTLKDAEGFSGGATGKGSSFASERSLVTATPTATAIDTPGAPASKPKGGLKKGPLVPAPTSIAVDAAAGVVGAVRHICMVAIGRGSLFSDGSAAAASLGIMASLGWDAVAVVLHLLDWTCPDMVVGRVLRRAPDTRQPLCVQAEMYYGIEGTAKESGEGVESVAGSVASTRPAYLCVSLHIADSGSGNLSPIDEEKGDLYVFQQSLRIVGTKAVLAVGNPLLPAASTSNAASPPSPMTTPTAVPAAGGSPTFAVTTALLAPSFASSTATTAVASGTSAMATAPKVSHSYRLATQDVSTVSGQRERHEEEVTVGNAEPCAEFRTWQHVRSQLNVTATLASPSSRAGPGTYQPYNSYYTNRGGGVGLGAGGGYYNRGRGMRGRGTGFGGGLSPGSTVASGLSVSAEVVDAEVAALDVQRAWLVQIVVELILASAAKLSP